MKRLLTAFAVLCAACMTVFAQGGYQVKGVVVDAIGPVIGASVIEQGTSNGVSTGLDGDFLLTVSSADAIVEISCIGYASQTFAAKDVPASILLEEDTNFLDEVVVIGYGTVKKSDMTGSVSTVKADEINKGVITTPADLIRGKSAGVVVTAGSGRPGDGAMIRIRGGSSINASNDPLIVIDGLPVSNDGMGGADPLSSINPSDIESFTVLKDASATAIYGSRASNGVIVITTKKGSKVAKQTNVSVDLTTSVNTIAKYNSLLDANELRSLIRDFYGLNSPAEAAMGNANTNWQKEIYQAAPSVDANLSLTGRIGENMPYRISGGATAQTGTLKGTEMERYTLSMNLSPSFFDKHLNVNLNGKFVATRNNWVDEGAIGAANHYDPSKPVYDPNGLNGYTTWYGTGGTINTMATKNPVAILEDISRTGNTNRFIGNAQFDYKLHGFEDLRMNLNLGIDVASSNNTNVTKEGSESSYHNTSESGMGSHEDYTYTRRNTTLEFYADYSHTFAEKHFVDLMAGYSWQHFWSKNHTYKYRIADNAEMTNTDGKGELYLVSFFGRANYSFADRYLITATLRADGTSRFQNNKWGIFPSVALGWNIKNEPFMKNVQKLSTLKLRASWGETGQQEVGKYYDTFATFLTINTPGSYYFTDGTSYAAPIVANGYSANLKWETTTTYNIGLDLGFWNDRITAAIDVYKRDTRDILNFVSVPGGSNLTNMLNTNIGTMTNKGVEFDLNTILIEKRDMSWNLGFNMAYNYNMVTKLTASDENATGVETGGISGGTGNNVQMITVGYPMRTFNLYQQVYDAQGRPISGVYVDRNNDGSITSDDKYLAHHPAPDFTFGFNTSFSWKNWTAALSGHASIGNWVYNNVASDTEMLADLYTNNFVSNRVSSAVNSRFSQAQYLSDYYLQDGSFLKLDNFTLGYTFPKVMEVSPDRFASLNIFGTVQNIVTFTKYTGIDPEIGDGIDNAMYPRPRTFVAGVKFNF
ncbi:MAG TPA: SusC/RagA family protein [Rikenellaceae bacterium]|nr:SusC/RagA family protein [Rikenellaceae bacterium]